MRKIKFVWKGQYYDNYKINKLLERRDRNVNDSFLQSDINRRFSAVLCAFLFGLFELRD